MPDDKVDILIVDDLADKVLVYKTILDELGENIVVARSGPEALAQVLRREFAVILLDVYMPEMDGLETAALIRQRRKSAHTPIIFVTAFADEVRIAQGYAHGAVDYILAPVIPEVLRAKVKVFVDLFRMTRQLKRQAEERVALAEERSRRAAAEEANRRLALLAKAGAVLGRVLDRERTAADTARLPVPMLADVATVALAGSAGGALQAFTFRSVGGDAIADESGDPPSEFSTLINRAFAEGVTVFDPEPASGADLAPVALAFPLSAAGRTPAVLALARADADRPFTLADLAAADTLASRAAGALENARLYQEIQQADRQKNEFLSMLAHELRNPLAPIRNSVNIMRAAADDPAQLQWAAGVIERQVGHMVRLVDDLLDISRINRGKIRLRRDPVDVAAVVSQAVEASRPEIDARHHELNVMVPSQPLHINGDPTRLAQVVTNLLNNAAKYTRPGGRIWLAVETADGPPAGRNAVIRVRDTGIGIPPAMLGTVFDLFTQGDHSLDRSEGGLGIGLTLVRRLVELHGGSVRATSDGPGLGSEFTVWLPVAVPEEQCTEAGGQDHGAADAVANPSPLRVLVVDDNEDGADSLARLLRLDGHAVQLSHTGPAALALANDFRPDAVVLDIGLPGMDGYEVARRLRDRPESRDALLVAVTGYGREEDRVLSREAGFDYHFVKPTDLDGLRRVLGTVEGTELNGTVLSNACSEMPNR
jgi:signal transduction histidine kinase/DNA-binding response OmpR family regulator